VYLLDTSQKLQIKVNAVANRHELRREKQVVAFPCACPVVKVRRGIGQMCVTGGGDGVIECILRFQPSLRPLLNN
jgi:hypothetical protein